LRGKNIKNYCSFALSKLKKTANIFPQIRMKKQIIILLFIIGLGTFLRLYGIWNFPLTHDELSVIGRLHFDTFSDLIEKSVKEYCHPAGIQVFLWLWIKIFGISEISLRMPFIMMGISCIPLMYLLTKKWFNATAALFTSGFMAVCQYTCTSSAKSALL